MMLAKKKLEIELNLLNLKNERDTGNIRII
jgi:hypothetical protein